jgi:glycogen debranching enzyme
VAGLLRYGFNAEAQRIATALLEAAEYSDGRLPELFCGFDRQHVDEPVPYPTACSPQAWAATAPIMLVKSLMGYYADVALGGLWMNPMLPESYGDVHISNAPMAEGRITIDVSGSTATVQGMPEGMVLHHGYRPWAADLVVQARRRERP